LGLFIGKQVGVFGFIWLSVRLGLAKIDTSINWGSLFGMSVLCGIGFTMSLFVGSLSFNATHTEYILTHRLGILIGSFTAAIVGYVILINVLPKYKPAK
jgi:Na+:H+ antiporter, NhaA family